MNTSDRDSYSNQNQHITLLDQIKQAVTNLVSPQHTSVDTSLSTHETLYFPLQTHHTPSISQTRATFMAFVDAVIPSTLGGLDLRLDDYLIWALDHYMTIQGDNGMKSLSLSSPTAGILDAAALQVILSGPLKAPPNFFAYPNGGPFAGLSVDDRFETIHLLENAQIDLENLPSPFRNNVGLVKNIVTNIHQIVMISYYSEWYAHGATRMAHPENRTFERPFLTWTFVNYPGTSTGYREHRGFLVKKFKN